MCPWSVAKTLTLFLFPCPSLEVPVDLFFKFCYFLCHFLCGLAWLARRVHLYISTAFVTCLVVAVWNRVFAARPSAALQPTRVFFATGSSYFAFSSLWRFFSLILGWLFSWLGLACLIVTYRCRLQFGCRFWGCCGRVSSFPQNLTCHHRDFVRQLTDKSKDLCYLIAMAQAFALFIAEKKAASFCSR